MESTSKVEKNMRHTNLPFFYFHLTQILETSRLEVRGPNLKIFQNLQIRMDLGLAGLF